MSSIFSTLFQSSPHFCKPPHTFSGFHTLFQCSTHFFNLPHTFSILHTLFQPFTHFHNPPHTFPTLQSHIVAMPSTIPPARWCCHPNDDAGPLSRLFRLRRTPWPAPKHFHCRSPRHSPPAHASCFCFGPQAPHGSPAHSTNCVPRGTPATNHRLYFGSASHARLTIGNSCGLFVIIGVLMLTRL